MESKTSEKIHRYSIEKSEKISLVILHILSYRTSKSVLKDKITNHVLDLFELLAGIGSDGWHTQRVLAMSKIVTLEGLLTLAERLGSFPAGSAHIISIELRELFAFLDEYGHLITGEPVRVDRESLKVNLLAQSHAPVAHESRVTNIQEQTKDSKNNEKKLKRTSQGQIKVKSENNGETRKMIILSQIEKGVSLSIKDIHRAIPSMSGKTLQRELSALVDAGVLKKEGVRRWTLYSLAV